MQLGAFLRNRIPTHAKPIAGQQTRLAAARAVNFGQEISQSEQSLVTAGPYAFVVSSVPQRKMKSLPARGSYLRGLLIGVTREPIMGLAM